MDEHAKLLKELKENLLKNERDERLRNLSRKSKRGWDVVSQHHVNEFLSEEANRGLRRRSFLFDLIDNRNDLLERLLGNLYPSATLKGQE